MPEISEKSQRDHFYRLTFKLLQTLGVLRAAYTGDVHHPAAKLLFEKTLPVAECPGIGLRHGINHFSKLILCRTQTNCKS